MPEIGLFPLSLVLMPAERAPLHIFETRYKELINSCLADDAPFGMVLVDADQAREIGTRAHVVEVLQRFEDGRLNVIVEGGERFRILETHAVHSYFTAEIAEYADEAAPPGSDTFDAFLGEYLGVFDQLGMDAPQIELDSKLSFRVAAQLALGLDDKQELLQMRSETERLDKLSQLLPRAVFDARKHQVRRRAPTNGHARRLLDR
ncbi:MAG: LON peptidase substrate-binding domain-containing protein [Actinobacteria bacterium]|nr:LON peptidase substrate-binding domain-containing protein [Actinomycetota bacterium]